MILCSNDRVPLNPNHGSTKLELQIIQEFCVIEAIDKIGQKLEHPHDPHDTHDMLF